MRFAEKFADDGGRVGGAPGRERTITVIQAGSD